MSTQQRSRWWELTRSSLIWGYWPVGQDEKYNMTFVRCQQLAGYFLSKGGACLFANGWKGDIPHTELHAISAVDSETLSQHGRLTFDVDVE